MNDQDRWETLGRVAESQAGYVTTAQAEQAGFHRNALRHHTREGGRLERAGRGLYRLRFYPSSPFDHIAAAWVLAGPEIAVVSHESALELYDLSDVVPSKIHLTLPRRYRHRAAPIGVRFHYPREPLSDGEVRRVHGLPATSPERTILDALEAGTQPEQIEMAVHQAVDRALTTPKRLRAAAAGRAATVRATVERLLRESGTRAPAAFPGRGAACYEAMRTLIVMGKDKKDKTVGPWTLHEKVGKGGNADVWRASRDEEEVALKVIHSTMAKSEQYRRFVREVEFLRSIPDEPGVLPLIDSHLPDRPSSDNRAWLAMPVATPIADALGEAALEEVVAALAEIASTLACLRAEHNVAHRDLKPGNLYFGQDKWLVGDFGLIALPNVAELTRNSRRLGPAHYTPYELILDPAGADPFPADVYSLGKTLWVLATGLGFPPEGHQPAGTRSYSINDLRPHANAAALDRLVDRATRLHAEERPTMQEVGDDLAAWQRLGKAVEAIDVSELGSELRKRLEGQIAAEDLLEQRREFALASARRLQELVQHLNDALLQVMPRAEIGISGDPSARTLLHAADGFGRELVVWKFDRTSRISVGERHFPFDFSFGVGLDLTEGGTLVFHSFVLAANRGVLGSDYFWQSQPVDAPAGSVAAERMLEERIAELTEQFKVGIKVFAEKAAEKSSS